MECVQLFSGRKVPLGLKTYSSTYKIKDVNLGGKAISICMSFDERYLFVYHEKELEDDIGISVLEIAEDNLLEPVHQYMSLKEIGFAAAFNMDINNQGLLLSTYRSPLNEFDFSENEGLVFLSNDIELFNVAQKDVVFTSEGDRCFITTENGFAIIEVDAEKNTTLNGYWNTSYSNPNQIKVTADSRIIFESFNSPSSVVLVLNNNEDGSITHNNVFEFDSGVALRAITPDGQYAVACYGYTPAKTDWTVFKIHEDHSVQRLIEKDFIGPHHVQGMILYQLPPMAVEDVWEIY